MESNAHGNGVESLRKRRAPGRPSRLTQDQLKTLTDTYQAGPRAAGFESDRWTTARFADAIFNHFGVRYDPDHAGRIMHRLGLRERRRSRQAVPDVLYTFAAPAVEIPGSSGGRGVIPEPSRGGGSEGALATGAPTLLPASFSTYAWRTGNLADTASGMRMRSCLP